MGLGTDSELVWLDSATNIAILATKGECKIAWRAADWSHGESCRVGGEGGDAGGRHPVDQEPGIPLVLRGGLRLIVGGNPTYILVAL